jgi:hypothetical protein
MSAPRTDSRPPYGVIAVLTSAFLIIVTYWALWYADRGAVASASTAVYTAFENSFTAADAWLAACIAAGGWCLATRRQAALFWLLAGGGAGVYLFGMDGLYDIQHRVWWTSGAPGWVELGLNVATLSVSVGILGWTWRHRAALYSPAPRGGESALDPDASPAHASTAD